MAKGIIKCLTCGKKTNKKYKYFPFCSKKCSLVDLDNWLRGKYAIKGENIYIKNGSLNNNKEG